MGKRDYYKLVKKHWRGDIWHNSQGIVIKCYTEEEVSAYYKNCGELWEKFEKTIGRTI